MALDADFLETGVVMALLASMAEKVELAEGLPLALAELHAELARHDSRGELLACDKGRKENSERVGPGVLATEARGLVHDPLVAVLRGKKKIDSSEQTQYMPK